MAEAIKSPWVSGYEAAMIPPEDGQPTNPYPEDDPRWWEWLEGYSQWAEDALNER